MKIFIIALLPLFLLTGLGTSIVLTTDIIEQSSRIQNQYEIEESNEPYEPFIDINEDYSTIE